MATHMARACAGRDARQFDLLGTSCCLRSCRCDSCQFARVSSFSIDIIRQSRPDAHNCGVDQEQGEYQLYDVGRSFLTAIHLQVGRLRPDFLDRCAYDLVEKACTGPLELVKDGRRSFPSGACLKICSYGIGAERLDLIQVILLLLFKGSSSYACSLRAKTVRSGKRVCGP